PLLDRDVAPVDKAGLAQALAKRSHYVIKRRRRCVAKEADDRYRRLLRPHRKRPSCSSAEQGDELATSRPITASASESRLWGLLPPSAFAVFRLTTTSNLVTCCTGRSAGFVPWRMRTTKSLACRYVPVRLVP